LLDVRPEEAAHRLPAVDCGRLHQVYDEGTDGVRSLVIALTGLGLAIVVAYRLGLEWERERILTRIRRWKGDA
jgi:hypothetical protein